FAVVSVFVSLVIVIAVAVTIVSAARRQRAEQSVIFVLDASGEEQHVGRTGIESIAEVQTPQAGNRYRLSVRAVHQELEIAGLGVEGRDLPTAELADQQTIAHLAEVTRRLHYTPR